MNNQFNNIQIKGISVAVPSSIESNHNASEYIGDKRCKKQIKITGIESRHVTTTNQKMSDLCYVAARDLIRHLDWSPNDIKVLILVTQHANYVTPSTAFLIQKLLGLPNECVVFDVNLGCSSFNVGFQIVSSLLQQYDGNAKGICLQGDLAYPTINCKTDINTMVGNMLFGAAGSATAIEKGSTESVIPYATYSDGCRYDAILRKHGNALKMDGEGVYNFSTNDVPDSINLFMKDNGITDPMIDYYVFHQAQKLILDGLVSSIAIDCSKELRSLKEYGNTSGASIPLSICANKELYPKEGVINFFTCGFGVGLSWSMALMPINSKNILPIIYTDELFEG